MATHSLTDSGQPPAVADRSQETSARAVSAGFQCRYFLRLAAAVACGAIVAGAIVYALLASDLGGYAESVTVLAGVRQSVLAAAVLSGLIQLVVTGTLAVVLALLASHKIAGPAARLLGCLRSVSQGRLPGAVHFRQGDQVGRLEDCFNDVSRALTGRHERLVRKLDDVRAAEDDLRRASGSPEDQQAAGRRLRERADELARLLASAAGEDMG